MSKIKYVESIEIEDGDNVVFTCNKDTVFENHFLVFKRPEQKFMQMKKFDSIDGLLNFLANDDVIFCKRIVMDDLSAEYRAEHSESEACARFFLNKNNRGFLEVSHKISKLSQAKIHVNEEELEKFFSNQKEK